MINVIFYEENTTSNDFLVSEEVFEIGDLKVCSGNHDDDRDGAESDDSTFDESVLLLKIFFVHDQHAEFISYLFNHVLDLLCL